MVAVDSNEKEDRVSYRMRAYDIEWGRTKECVYGRGRERETTHKMKSLLERLWGSCLYYTCSDYSVWCKMSEDKGKPCCFVTTRERIKERNVKKKEERVNVSLRA